MPRVILRPGRAKPLWMGHPWVHADSVQRVEAEDGSDWVEVLDADGRFVGRGFLSPTSALRVRLLTRETGEQDAATALRLRLERALTLRRRLFPDPGRNDAFRLVHAEGDGLPGLVVDRLGAYLVAQFATRPMHARREGLSAWLLERSGCRGLLARPAGHERVEGIPADESPFVAGTPPPERLLVQEEGLQLEVSPLRGQKTGHYADQRENRVHVGRLAAGLDVLDLYAGTGGFALQCLRHGARHAVAVESSAGAAEAARGNAARNGLAEGLEVRQDDVAANLAQLRAEKRRFGLVVADPPNFFPRRGPERGARKAYRELNVRALSRVEDGGFLATFSCSARWQPAGFLEMLRSASRECRRTFRVLRELAAGPDHPVSAGLPEGRYLTGLLLQVEPQASSGR